MDIRLKQPQIEAALRGYLIKQGIDLTGRTVEIAFTAGRGGNGLMADIALSEGNLKEDIPPVRQLVYEPTENATRITTEVDTVPFKEWIAHAEEVVVNIDSVQSTPVTEPVESNKPLISLFS